jgi:type II secretory pathway predicted ATPase ExeA
MSPRHSRKAAAADRAPEYTPEEIEHLTLRADELLRQLHEVLEEMSEHLESVATGGDK